MDAGFLWGNRNEEGHLENLGVDGRVRGRVVSQFGWAQRHVTNGYEHSNEAAGFIK
jgi:hypothetical protein